MNASKENCAEAMRLLTCASDRSHTGLVELTCEEFIFLYECLSACRSRLPCDATIESHRLGRKKIGRPPGSKNKPS